MTELEQAISHRQKNLKLLLCVALVSLLLLIAMAYSTYQNFDTVYAQKLSVYPATSAIATLPNVFGVVCLTLLVVAVLARVQRANQALALKAYSLLMSQAFQARQTQHSTMINRFLHAAGLPSNYSMNRLAKVKTYHFVSHSFAISRVVAKDQATWIAVSRATQQ